MIRHPRGRRAAGHPQPGTPPRSARKYLSPGRQAYVTPTAIAPGTHRAESGPITARQSSLGMYGWAGSRRERILREASDASRGSWLTKADTDADICGASLVCGCRLRGSQPVERPHRWISWAGRHSDQRGPRRAAPTSCPSVTRPSTASPYGPDTCSSPTSPKRPPSSRAYSDPQDASARRFGSRPRTTRGRRSPCGPSRRRRPCRHQTRTRQACSMRSSRIPSALYEAAGLRDVAEWNVDVG